MACLWDAELFSGGDHIAAVMSNRQSPQEPQLDTNRPATIENQTNLTLLIFDPSDLDFGANLSTFVYQILRYVRFNTGEKTFPFVDWPSLKGEIGNNPTSVAPKSGRRGYGFAY